jgi:hypothetical protein
MNHNFFDPPGSKYLSISPDTDPNQYLPDPNPELSDPNPDLTDQ